LIKAKKIRPKKCPSCNEKFTPVRTLQPTCDKWSCQRKYLDAVREKKLKKEVAKKNREHKEERREHKKKKDAVKKRSDWYADLQKEVNWHVLHVKEKGKPCRTCGKTNDVKYDAGHFLSRGARPELRFETTNIHKQCSNNCNKFGAGMRKEYTEFIISEYGQDHLDWLIGPHPTLKEQFPTIDDIRKEIAKQRKINREAKKAM